jgi:hypothetical protein
VRGRRQRVRRLRRRTDVSYYCDTAGGSSGSPVLSRKTGKVVALHHFGGCPNSGVRADLLATSSPVPLALGRGSGDGRAGPDRAGLVVRRRPARAFAALTYALARGHLLALDRQVADWADQHRPAVLYWPARVLNYLGQGGQVLMPVPFCWR